MLKPVLIPWQSCTINARKRVKNIPFFATHEKKKKKKVSQREQDEIIGLINLLSVSDEFDGLVGARLAEISNRGTR